MQARADVCGEQHVAGDDRLLGDRRPAAEPELAGDLALVHLGALGQPGLLGVLGDDAVEGLHVLQRAAHDDRVVHALAVVGEDPDVRRGLVHRAELGELLALQADGDGADRLHVAVAGGLAEPPDLLDHARGVRDGEGVGHRVDGGEAAPGRRLGAGQHGLGVLAAGLAQVGVQVHQAGQDDQAVGVDVDVGLDVEAGADRLDDAVGDVDVLRDAAVEDLGVADQVADHDVGSLAGRAHRAASLESVRTASVRTASVRAASVRAVSVAPSAKTAPPSRR